MYNTIEEVIVAVKEKYEGVDKLSYGCGGGSYDCAGGSCFYGPGYNGVGCAVGCLLPRETNWNNIEHVGIHTLMHTAYNSVFRQVFASTITVDELTKLQRAHDFSKDVDEFLFRLDHRLATGEWIDSSMAEELMNTPILVEFPIVQYVEV